MAIRGWENARLLCLDARVDANKSIETIRFNRRDYPNDSKAYLNKLKQTKIHYFENKWLIMIVV